MPTKMLWKPFQIPLQEKSNGHLTLWEAYGNNNSHFSGWMVTSWQSG